jgi:uncharacterized protein YjfI (DUF2170 family)
MQHPALFLPLLNSLNFVFRINVMLGVLALKNEIFIVFCALTAHQTPTRMLSKITSYNQGIFGIFRINVMVGVISLKKNEIFIMFCALTAHQTPTRMLSKLTSYTPRNYWRINIIYFG